MIASDYRRGLFWISFAALVIFIYREWVTVSAPIRLFFDEAYYYGWSQNLDWGFYSKPPMVALLIRITTDLFGNAEWAIKLAAPALYSGAAVLIYQIGSRLTSVKAGLYSALLFLSMPLVSFNSLFITTDAPLLFFWALALLLFLVAQERDTWAWWLSAGLVGGLGLLSKYTFILFPAAFLLYAMVSQPGRAILANPKFWVACVLALLVLSPNLVWNWQHDFISFQHTAEISKQTENAISLSRLLEFFGSQFLVFGPVSFFILLLSLFKPSAWRDNPLRLLWALFIPIFLVICIQALTGRANVNWGAPAYVSGSLLVGILLAKADKTRLIRVAVGLNLLLMLGFYHYHAVLGLLSIDATTKNDPYNRIDGWHQLAEQIQRNFDKYPDAVLASDSRKVLAYFSYYIHPQNLTPRALNTDDHIKHQYELLYPVSTSEAEQHLFVSEHPRDTFLPQYFEQVELIDTQSVQVRQDLTRTAYVYLVSGYRGAE